MYEKRTVFINNGWFFFCPSFGSLRNFKRALNDVIQSRRAIRNMNTLYPDATADELAAVDNVCIICREEMQAGKKYIYIFIYFSLAKLCACLLSCITYYVLR